jgi:hypothetical protein
MKLLQYLLTFVSTRCFAAALFLLFCISITANAQNSCMAECKSPDSPCAELKGAQRAQCVSQCQKKCKPEPPPPPLLDPRCGNRAATGKFTCTIEQPVVNKHETEYPAIQFAPNDVVEVEADGCVQTGGWGDTWKRYVNPSGDGIADKYHGLIRIPTAKPAGSGLVRIETVIGKLQTLTGIGLPVSQLILHLGYEDDGYSDNGYYSHDDGNNDQCKIGGPHDGGPAHVTITICRGVPCATPQSGFDFDVLSATVDSNGLPYNPQWSWQQRPANHGQIPNTSLCHEFSGRSSTLGVPSPFLSPSFSDCTDQADPNSVDLPFPDSVNDWGCKVKGALESNSFAGHVNWFPVTLEGRAGWGDHDLIGDDDYTFTFDSEEQGNPLSVNTRHGLHVEFDSDETIDHFSSSEWSAFHSAVGDSNDNPSLAQKLFDGHTILTGMFGLDGEHNLKAELHPLFAIATRRDNFENDPGDEVWLMFARNRGDEGFCSSQLWDSGFEDYTVRLPWRSGMSSVDVNWSKTEFEGTDGTSGPTVRALPPTPLSTQDAGVYVTFHLGPSSSSPFIDGSLHLSWLAQPVNTTGTGNAGSNVARAERARNIAGLAGATMGGQAAGENDEVEHRIRAAIKQLPPAQRLQVQQARAAVIGVRPALHRLAPGGPVQKITAPPAIFRISRLHAIKAGPATRKLERDAAEIRALCLATHGAPPGLPPEMCKGTVRDHR